MVQRMSGPRSALRRSSGRGSGGGSAGEVVSLDCTVACIANAPLHRMDDLNRKANVKRKLEKVPLAR